MNYNTNGSNKAVFFSSKLHRGGAEKHLVRLCNYLNKQGWEIVICVTQGGGGYESILDKDVKVIYPRWEVNSYSLGLLVGMESLMKVLRQEKPKLVFSIQDGPNVVALATKQVLRSGIPFLIGVQNNPLYLQGQMGKLLRFLLKRLYLRADHCVSLSSGVGETYEKLVPTLSQKLSVVHNIGFEKWQDRSSRSQPGGAEFKLLAVGRLVEQKDYPTMLRGLQLLLKKHPGITLTILGDGVLKESLEQLAQELGVNDNIHFAGFVSDPNTYYLSHDLMILSSRWEGFGNVIVEAMSHGLPVVAADCPFGPSEIIEDKINGCLFAVGNFTQMATKVEEIIAAPGYYAELSRNAIERAKDFSAEKIGSQYGQVFDRFVAEEN